MGKVVTYFKPKKRLYAVPLEISADYNRRQMTQQQAILMMAAKARDPQQAEKLLAELQAQHGKSFWQQIRLQVLRLVDHKTFAQRLLILFRRAFGESDSPVPKIRYRRSEEPIALYRYKDHD